MCFYCGIIKKVTDRAHEIGREISNATSNPELVEQVAKKAANEIYDGILMGFMGAQLEKASEGSAKDLLEAVRGVALGEITETEGQKILAASFAARQGPKDGNIH